MTAMSAPETIPGLVPDRACGSCVSCCSFFNIAELDKPAGTLCAHSMPGGGCDIYAERPRACRVFFCAWRCWDEVPEDWRPDRTGFILGGRLMPRRFLSVTTDPLLPESWRAEPYFSRLMAWARQASAARSEVVIFSGRRVMLLRPEGVVDFGEVGPDEVLIQDPDGHVAKVRRDDPRVTGAAP
jgi:hypothetical protein